MDGLTFWQMIVSLIMAGSIIIGLIGYKDPRKKD
jgi:hypothetical protein